MLCKEGAHSSPCDDNTLDIMVAPNVKTTFR